MAHGGDGPDRATERDSQWPQVCPDHHGLLHQVRGLLPPEEKEWPGGCQGLEDLFHEVFVPC